MMAFRSILTYIVRAGTWPSDSDIFLLNLQSSEQATEDISACMKQSPTECVPSASEILPWQIVWCFLWGYEGMQRDEEGIVHRNPTAKGTRGQVTRCGAAGWSCSLPGNLPCWGAGKVLGFLKSSPALWSPASPCCKWIQGHITRQPGLRVTNPAPEPISLPGTGKGAAGFWSNTSTALGKKALLCCPPFTQALTKTNSENSHFPLSKSWIFWYWSNRHIWRILVFAQVCDIYLGRYKASFVVLTLALKQDKVSNMTVPK